MDQYTELKDIKARAVSYTLRANAKLELARLEHEAIISGGTFGMGSTHSTCGKAKWDCK